MKPSKQKPVIDAEAFMKFFEETASVKFVDAETGQPALDVLAKQKGETKSDYDLWLEEQDNEEKVEKKVKGKK